MSQEEKREHPRIDADLRLRWADPIEVEEMKVCNLSLGGAYCLSPRSFDPMTRMEVILDLPGGTGVVPLWAEAVVVRVDEERDGDPRRPYRVALWFQRMSEGHRLSLRRYLGRNGH